MGGPLIHAIGGVVSAIAPERALLRLIGLASRVLGLLGPFPNIIGIALYIIENTLGSQAIACPWEGTSKATAR